MSKQCALMSDFMWALRRGCWFVIYSLVPFFYPVLCRLLSREQIKSWLIKTEEDVQCGPVCSVVLHQNQINLKDPLSHLGMNSPTLFVVDVELSSGCWITPRECARWGSNSSAFSTSRHPKLKAIWVNLLTQVSSSSPVLTHDRTAPSVTKLIGHWGCHDSRGSPANCEIQRGRNHVQLLSINSK